VDLSERSHAGRRHPWEVERARFLIDRIGRHDGFCATRVADVGAGDAFVAGQLRPHLGANATITCWDPNYSAEDLAADRPDGVTLVRDRPTGSHDLVLLLDVLEHVEDPETFLLDDVAALVEPGSLVVASVPTFQVLFGRHDRSLGHHRRYRPAELVRQLGTVCDVVDDGPLFVSLLAPRAGQVVAERVLPDRGDHPVGLGEWTAGPRTTAAVTAALRADTRACGWLARRRLPVRGLSHWAVGIVR
jgi:hypothetical protein